MTELSASILSCHPFAYEAAIKQLIQAGIKRIHFDVMDGQFVPNLSFGPDFLGTIRKQYPELIIDAHLMVFPNPKILASFIHHQPHSIILHYESASNIEYWLEKIPSPIKKGLAIKPGPIPDELLPLLSKIDILLIMTVEPGFGGQSFIESQTQIIEQFCTHKRQKNLDFLIGVDGGITRKNVKNAQKHGAELIISGADLVMPVEEISNKCEEFCQILA